MKMILIALAFLGGMSTYAQNDVKKEKDPQRIELSADQKRALHVKELTLQLDLNEKQQKDIDVLLKEQQTQREAAFKAMKEKKEKGVKPTADEMFQMRAARLDQEITFKDKLKTILSAEQLQKFEAKNQKNDFRGRKADRKFQDGQKKTLDKKAK